MSAESASASLLGAGQGETSATSGMQQFEDRSFDATNYIQSACECFWSLGILPNRSPSTPLLSLQALGT